MKKYLKHILALLLISFATITIFQMFYVIILDNEKQHCWQELESTVEDMNKQIRIKFTDEISKLHLVEILMQNLDGDSLKEVESLHLNQVQPSTIFSRIDILYPDGTLLSNGTFIDTNADLPFEEIEARGEYLTSRKTDFMTGDPCIYYVLPVTAKGDTAILIGVIECDSLHDLFQPTIYNGEANICIIDADDGNYIMDNWHSELGNMYALGDRERLPGYEDVDFHANIANLRAGSIAFVSRTTGAAIYMYYAPLNIFNWEIAVFTTEDVLFSSLISLRRSFILAGCVEILLLALYCLWNLYLIRQLQKTNAEIEHKKERLEFLSYRDMLTGLYNRHKYFEVLSAYIQAKPDRIGIAYIDLNGLKQINDSRSHEAGDEYICTTAKLLTDHFGERCYRIGGDEFVVIVPGIEQETFSSSITALRAATARAQVSLSIGSVWQAKVDDLHALINTAEKEMYAEKKAYYQTQNASKLTHYRVI